MSAVIEIENGHLSLEYDNDEHVRVLEEVRKIDPNFQVKKRLESSAIYILGSKFVSGMDELSCFLIADSRQGDAILKRISAGLDLAAR